MLSGGIWRCLCEAFFLVVVINGSGGDLVFAIDLSDDRISVLKAVAVKMIWSCRAWVCTGGSINGCFTGGLLVAGVSLWSEAVAHGSGGDPFVSGF